MDHRSYKYKRYFLDSESDDDLAHDLQTNLFEPNVNTSNEEIIAFERKRIQRVLQINGVE